MISFLEYLKESANLTSTWFNLKGEKAVDYTQFSNKIVKKIFESTLKDFAVSSTNKPIHISELDIPFKNDDRFFLDRIKKTVTLDRLKNEGKALTPITIDIDIKRSDDYTVTAKFTAVDEIEMRAYHGHRSFAYTKSMEQHEYHYEFRQYPVGDNFKGPENGKVTYESKVMLKKKDKWTVTRKVVTTIKVSVTDIMTKFVR